MTEFEVINRFVDVDGTNKIIIGVQGLVRIKSESVPSTSTKKHYF